ncbi:MAG: DUF2147 domain-containing protein [Methyloceanibacter sp.]
MKHHAFAAAMGLLTAAVLVPGGQAQASAADPTGYWVKPDAERNAKIQITRCGKGKAQLCSNIVWLENPNDNQGRLLQDVRNENPSMRGRSIQGLPLFTGLTRTGPTTWTGKIYNPEDGNTYAATLTMVSKSQIVLKGCKAWLLCGERVWKRTSPPPQPQPAEEQLIEAKAEPEAEPKSAPAQATAAAMPSAAKQTAYPQTEPTPDVVETTAEPRAEMDEPKIAAAPAMELVTPTAPPAAHAMHPGYGFLNVSRSEATATELSGQDVPSMFVMTAPLETEAVAPPPAAAPETAAPPAPPVKAAVPAPKPKPQAPREAAPQATAAATPRPQPPAQPAPAGEAAPAEASQQTAHVLDQDQETAEPFMEAPPPLTRRQRRMLRRQQQQPLLPWLR